MLFHAGLPVDLENDFDEPPVTTFDLIGRATDAVRRAVAERQPNVLKAMLAARRDLSSA